MRYAIRLIEPADDAQVEALIRGCLVEFCADREGTAWADPDLGRLSAVYRHDDDAYWVATDEAGTVVAGVGIAPLAGAEGVCELQKMYCAPAARGTGVARRLIEEALAFASARYDSCYLETLENMVAAQRLYERYGFSRIDEPLADTGHFRCDVRYLRPLGAR